MSSHTPSIDREKTASTSITSIHVLALDGIVNVNSLFTVGVFLGLAWNLGDPNNTLVASPVCTASSGMVEDFVKFHVYSFSSFLFSSLIALALKQAIRSSKDGYYGAEMHSVARVNLKVLQSGILASALGSVAGCVFLTLALVDFVQIKLGTLACRSWYTAGAVFPLVILVPSALVIYIYVVLHAFTR
ncbi:uncharacterized protein [Coffea arabica]|uniref:Maternal effect embryo arrest 60 n=1 Tax=Coffea arabica TaxID=13443 RepID=A0A6P6UGU9_COFAR|nr:uncharacterized protein LOC113710324 [Coffea arabica]